MKYIQYYVLAILSLMLVFSSLNALAGKTLTIVNKTQHTIEVSVGGLFDKQYCLGNISVEKGETVGPHTLKDHSSYQGKVGLLPYVRGETVNVDHVAKCPGWDQSDRIALDVFNHNDFTLVVTPTTNSVLGCVVSP